MNKFLKILVFTIVGAALMFPIIVNAGMPLYRVSNGKKNIFIFGSVHVLAEQDYPLDKNIIDAYKKSKNVAFESLDSYFSAAGMPIARKLLAIEDGQLCDEYVGKKLFDEAFSIVYPNSSLVSGTVTSFVRSSHPYLLSLLVQYSTNMKITWNQAPGIEPYFKKLAISDQKNMIEVEGIENSSIKFLHLLTKSESILLLKNAVQFHYDEKIKEEIQKNSLETLEEYRTTGDVEKLYSFQINACNKIIGNPLSFCKGIFEARNQSMAEKIKSYFINEDSYFIILGSAHLGGDKNVLQRLKDSGLEINRIDTSN